MVLSCTSTARDRWSLIDTTRIHSLESKYRSASRTSCPWTMRMGVASYASRIPTRSNSISSPGQSNNERLLLNLCYKHSEDKPRWKRSNMVHGNAFDERLNNGILLTIPFSQRQAFRNSDGGYRWNKWRWVTRDAWRRRIRIRDPKVSSRLRFHFEFVFSFLTTMIICGVSIAVIGGVFVKYLEIETWLR